MKSPLSQAQLGVYYACETTVSEEFNYQNPVLFTLPEDADLTRLQQAVQEALCAHPYLGSHIVVNDEGIPEMESGERLAFSCQLSEVSEDEWKAAQETFAQTMDIHGDKLYRAEIYKIKAEGSRLNAESYLYIDIHHVLADGFSVTLLLRDIERIYNGKKPAGELMDGAAIAEEESRIRNQESGMMAEAKEWYAKTFCDAADTDSLPIVESRVKSQESRDEVSYQLFPLSVSKDDIQTIEKRFGAKESVIMQTAFAQLLATYSAEENNDCSTKNISTKDCRCT